MPSLKVVAIFFLQVPFPLIVLGTGVIGLVGSFVLPNQFNVIRGKQGMDVEEGYVKICEDPAVCNINPSGRRNALLTASFVLLWVVPITGLHLLPATTVPAGGSGSVPLTFFMPEGEEAGDARSYLVMLPSRRGLLAEMGAAGASPDGGEEIP